jgi:hypothetical protein
MSIPRNLSFLAQGASTAGVLSVSYGGTGTSSLTSGYVVKGNGTSAASASVIYDDGTNIGIGTASPGFKTEIVCGYNNGLQVKDTTATVYGGFFTESAQMALVTRSNHGLRFGTNDATRMTIDSSGNVGIGTSSPTNKLDVATSADAFASIRSTGTIQSAALTITGRQSSSDETWNIISTGSGLGSGSLRFTRGSWTGTPSALIDASGNLSVGGTNNPARFNYIFNGATTVGAASIDTSNSGTTAAFRFFRNTGTQVGEIATSTSGTSYNSSSDYRLKHDVQPLANGLVTIFSLKPVTYKWLADDSDGEGFIAHELQEVVPLAVTGEKDAVNEDGSIKPQGVDYSKIVVHLVAAIQELKAELDATKAEIAALKGAV